MGRVDTSLLRGDERRGNPAAGSGGDYRPIVPVPADAPPPPSSHPTLGEPSRVWTFTTAEGALAFFECRFVGAEGHKETRPLSYGYLAAETAPAWHWKAIPAGRQLYNLAGLAARPAAPVLLVEGPKAADAAAELFSDCVVVAASGGAKAAAKSDWSPLAGRLVIDWPDHDSAGASFAAAAVALAAEAGAELVAVVDVPATWPTKWDLADPLPEGVDVDQLHRMIEAATVVDGRPLAILETLRKDTTKAKADATLDAFARAAGRLDDLTLQRLKPEFKAILKDRRGPGLTDWLEEVLRRAKAGRVVADAPFRRSAEGGDDCPYRVEDGQLVLVTEDDGSKPLCNFAATIREEVTVDDGHERRQVWTIAGTHAGRPLPEIEVPATKYEAMDWVSQWGADVTIFAGRNTRDHCRAAVQLLSRGITRRTVYRHLGWRRLDSGLVFLHAAGAIGATGVVEGVEVDPPADLGRYRLPDPPQGEALRAAVRASMTLLDVAPLAVSAPLLGAMYRAPLDEVCPTTTAAFVAGRTGTCKSSTAAVFLSHFAVDGFTHDSLPAGWSSTGNSLEYLAAVARDVALVVDDFVPQGSYQDVARAHREADRFLRSVGNRQGRGRLKADGTMRPTYTPAGMVIATGEDLPRGQSLAARLVVVEIRPGDVDLDQLTHAQALAADGVLAQAMAGYVKWLAGRLDELDVRADVLAFRDRPRLGGHRRSPEGVGHLWAGLVTFVAFALDVGAVDAPEAAAALVELGQALDQLVVDQAQHILAADPVRRFLDLLSSLLTSGRGHFVDARNGGQPPGADQLGWLVTGYGEEATIRPQGRPLGWAAPGELILDWEAMWEEVSTTAGRQGEALPLSATTMVKRLSERGHLVVESAEHLRPKRSVSGRGRGRFVILRPSALDPDDPQDDGPEPGKRPEGAPVSDEVPQQCPGEIQQPGQANYHQGIDLNASAPVAPEICTTGDSSTSSSRDTYSENTPPAGPLHEGHPTLGQPGQPGHPPSNPTADRDLACPGSRNSPGHRWGNRGTPVDPDDAEVDPHNPMGEVRL